MYHSINAGRLRHYVQLFIDSNETDRFGQTIGSELVFDARANVKTTKGNEVQDYGTTMNSTVITVLMWFDERADTSMTLVYNGVKYDVVHVNPDEFGKSMILTCEVIKK